MPIAPIRENILEPGKTAGDWLQHPGPAAAGITSVLSWNIHECIGGDDRRAPERIARVIQTPAVRLATDHLPLLTRI